MRPRQRTRSQGAAASGLSGSGNRKQSNWFSGRFQQKGDRHEAPASDRQPRRACSARRRLHHRLRLGSSLLRLQPGVCRTGTKLRLLCAGALSRVWLRLSALRLCQSLLQPLQQRTGHHVLGKLPAGWVGGAASNKRRLERPPIRQRRRRAVEPLRAWSRPARAHLAGQRSTRRRPSRHRERF